MHLCLILSLSAFLLQAMCFPLPLTSSSRRRVKGRGKKRRFSLILALTSDFISGPNIYRLSHHNSSHYLLYCLGTYSDLREPNEVSNLSHMHLALPDNL